MNFPNFSQDQYIDADSLNSAFAAVSGSVATNMSATFYPGLSSPTSAALVVSGLTLNASLPAPFGVMFATGLLAQAHGTTDGADTQSYATSFSSLVPASGAAVTAYLVASYRSIQQTPVAIIGPPQGHPDFNPNFVPFTAYQNVVDSLSLSATATPPDNVATFELCRFTLTSGATGLPAPNTSSQVRYSGLMHVQTVTTPATGTTLTPSGKHYQLSVNDIYYLPPVSAYNDASFTFSATATGLTVVQAASGASFQDSIYGCEPSPAFAAPALLLLQGQACQLIGANGFWQVISGRPYIAMFRQLLTSNINLYVATTGSDITNTGLTAGSPFATMQKAWNTLLQNYDLGGNTATINVAAGTYAAGIVALSSLPGYGSVVVLATGPVTLSVTNASCFQATTGAQYTVSGGFTLSATGSGIGQGFGVTCSQGSIYVGAGITFGACSLAHIASVQNSTVYLLGSYTIAGNAALHWQAERSSVIVTAPLVNMTVTLTGTPNFSSRFASCRDQSNIYIPSAQMTYSGAASGQKYYVDTGGGIDTLTAASGTIPGSTAGLAVSGTYGWFA